jgi:hypothetical protein
MPNIIFKTMGHPKIIAKKLVKRPGANSNSKASSNNV